MGRGYLKTFPPSVHHAPPPKSAVVVIVPEKWSTTHTHILTTEVPNRNDNSTKIIGPGNVSLEDYARVG